MKFTKLALLMALLSITASSLFADEEVKNTAKPAGYTLELSEELRFGAEEEEDEFLWPGMGTKILPGPNGNMYIHDPSGNQILEFDKDGKFLRVATSQGNGPGEVQMIMTVTQSLDGTILLTSGQQNGMPRLMRFNADMSFRDEIDTRGMGFSPALINISPDGKYLGGTFVKVDMAAGGIFLKSGVIDLESKKIVNEFLKNQQPMPDPSRINEQSMWVEMIGKQVSMLYNFGVFTFAHDNTMYAGVSGKYLVGHYKPGQEKPIRTITRDYKPYPMGKEDKQAMADFFWDQLPQQARSFISKNTLEKGIEAADLPPRKTPIYGLIPIEDKGFMVIHHLDMKTRETVGDVYNNKGKFLCQLKVPNYGLYGLAAGNPSPRMVFKNGKAYTIETNEDGENQAVRYAYTLKK